MVTLTETQRRGLGELEAACDESIKYAGSGWVRTRDLGGMPCDRSSYNLNGLVAIGLVEKRPFGAPSLYKQGQWQWRITDAGRAALSKAEGGEGQG